MSDKDVHSEGGSNGDWTPAWPGQRPPFEPGNTAAVGHGHGAPPTHGAKSKRMLKPVAEHYLALLREAAPAGDVPADSFALERLAFRLAQIHLAENWLHEHGVVDRDGNPWPLARELVAWETNARKLMMELGLTAKSRAELRLDVLRGDLMTLAQAQAGFRTTMEVAIATHEAVLREALGEEAAARLGPVFRAAYLPAVLEALALPPAPPGEVEGG